MKVIDLRSDTVTLPTKEMLDAIAKAELGDDVSREDPTVNKLEQMAADRFGKEAGLLVTSGTAGNLISVMTHCRHGDEYLLRGGGAHLLLRGRGNVRRRRGHPSFD